MMRTSKLVAGVALFTAPFSTATGADTSFTLRAQVPVYCQVQQRSTGSGITSGSAVSLGQFREYCNAPGGYQLIVRYAPGTLRGAILTAGQDHVVLDGSGDAVLSRASGPRIRERAIMAAPGPGGFDTDRIEFRLVSS